jgi:hypothetical protein
VVRRKIPSPRLKINFSVVKCLRTNKNSRQIHSKNTAMGSRKETIWSGTMWSRRRWLKIKHEN